MNCKYIIHKEHINLIESAEESINKICNSKNFSQMDILLNLSLLHNFISLKMKKIKGITLEDITKPEYQELVSSEKV